MTLKELNKILSVQSEDENIEFKEVKSSISILGEKGKNRRSLYGYCVAIGNEGGGKIILGVQDRINPDTGRRDIVGTKAIQNIPQAKSQIFNKLGLRILINELITEQGKRVLVVTVPRRPVGQPLSFYGRRLMRSGEELVDMDDRTLKDILNEGEEDFSAQICDGISIKDLDANAIDILRGRWAKKSGSKDFTKLTDKDTLKKLLLMKGNKITYAGLLLLGKEEVLASHLANAEFIFEWRVKEEKTDFDARKIWRNAFLLTYDDIWNAINARNTRTPFKQGFFEFDVWAYDEQSTREAILNAFAHREYKNRVEPIFIKLTPDKLSVKSPGGFLPGVTPENVLYVEGKWRNRLLMETLEKVGLVERAGVGLDRIFKETISHGKGMPDFNGTDYSSVALNLPTKVKDINFVYFLEKISTETQISFDEVKDFIYLEDIRVTGRISDKKRLDKFLNLGVIEKTGKGRGTKYLLSKTFYEFIDKKAEYTRKKWHSKLQQRELLLNYLKQYKKGRVADFRELFEGKLTNQQINALLKELSDKGIYFDGKPRSPKAFWKLKDSKI